MKMKQKMGESQDATEKGQTTRVKLQIQMKRLREIEMIKRFVVVQ
jgi:hypothetical protein